MNDGRKRTSALSTNDTSQTLDVQAIPTALRNKPQWVGWQYEKREGAPKPTKVPINVRSGHGASTKNRKHWATFEEAIRRFGEGVLDGVGFVFNDDYTGIDLDNAYDYQAQTFKPWASEIISNCHTYVEFSPSKTGAHLISVGSLPQNLSGLNRPYQDGKVEIYSRGRFFTMTGLHVDGTPSNPQDQHEYVIKLYRRVAGITGNGDRRNNRSLGEPWLTDRELIDRAMAAENGAKFTKLWNGDTSDYDGDDSRADLAILCILAFWTNKNPEQMDRLFRQSRLMRPKWDRDDYRERTIQAALERTPGPYQLGRNRNHSELGKRERSHAQRQTRSETGPTVVVNTVEQLGMNNGGGANADEIDEDCDEIPLPVLNDGALQGVAGDIVRLIGPHTEADPAALLLQTVCAFGNVVGRNAYYQVEADRHYANTYLVLVGPTSKGRKGTSKGQVLSLYRSIDEVWEGKRVQSGLSSGEGLIWAVRDPITRSEPIKEKKKIIGYQDVICDQGIEDKRLLLIEPEFASTLRVLGRDGNTLSAVIRNGWDNGRLRTLTKNSPAQATDAHVSIVGHITQDELRRYLDSTEAGNGFANRFLWICVRRSKCLPEGGHISDVDFRDIVRRLQDAVDFARRAGRVGFDETARDIWHRIYPDLSEGQSGLLGAVTSRAEAQVVRLALVYALMDCSERIREPHLLAAIAVWDYAADSARYIFGDALGDPIADEILAALRRNPDGLTRTQISDLFNRNRSAGQIGRALSVLIREGRVRSQDVETEGRSAEVWVAISVKRDKKA